MQSIKPLSVAIRERDYRLELQANMPYLASIWQGQLQLIEIALDLRTFFFPLKAAIKQSIRQLPSHRPDFQAKDLGQLMLSMM